MLADALARAGSTTGFLAPGAALGTLVLAVALVYRRGLGVALFLGGATYVAFAVSEEPHRVEPTAPLVAVLLLLCGELAAWSVHERWRIQSDASLAWRRGATVAALGVAGLTAATLVVALSAVPSSHGLALTVAGAAAAVGAAAIGVMVARR